MKRTLLIAATLMTATLAHAADKLSKEGFDKLQANVDNAKANLEEYKKNLATVDANLKEIGTARSAVEDQRKKITAALKENKNSMVKMEQDEKTLNMKMTEEKSKMAGEEKKIQELEGLIAKLKENMGKREKNIQQMQQITTEFQAQKKPWTDQLDALKQQDAATAKRAKEISATEGEWKNKKRGYEGEVGRWTKEVDKQEKTLKQFSSLNETK